MPVNLDIETQSLLLKAGAKMRDALEVLATIDAELQDYPDAPTPLDSAGVTLSVAYDFLTKVVAGEDLDYVKVVGEGEAPPENAMLIGHVTVDNDGEISFQSVEDENG